MPQHDLVIIGGGPGGYVAAIYAAQKGLNTALVERAALGGTCLNWGCIPSKALIDTARRRLELAEAAEFGLVTGPVQVDWAAAMARKDKVVAQLVGGIGQLLKAAGVTVYQGNGQIPAPGRVAVHRWEGGRQGEAFEQLEADHIVIATGSAPFVPPIPGADLPGVIVSDQAVTLQRLPKSLVVIGGGVIGMELACMYQALGVPVTVLEMLPRILPPVDEELARRLAPTLRKRGLDMKTGIKVSRIERSSAGDGLAVHFEGAEGAGQVEGEYVLVSAGRRAHLGGIDAEGLGLALQRGAVQVDEYLRTNLPGVYAIGDVNGGLQLAHVASHQGILVVDQIRGHGRPWDPSAVPAAVFTLPEIAWVGLTEKAAQEAGHSVKVGKFPFTANGKALASGTPDGIVKIVAEAENGKVLGVHVLGAHASDLVHEGVLAVTLGRTVQEVAETIHIHPTMAEAMGEAALATFGLPIHIAARPSR